MLRAIGVVESVQGISWQEITVEGQSNHAGTTPMRFRHDAGYAAAAITVFLRQLAGEIGPTRVVGIAPGLVQTDFAAFLVENFGERLAASLPLGRLGVPEDIANLAVFLASDLAAWITGETFVIDGGAGVRTTN